MALYLFFCLLFRLILFILVCIVDMINSKKQLTPEDLLHLFWFANTVKKQDVTYKDFIVTQELIDNYNNYLKRWSKAVKENPVKYSKVVDWNIDRPKSDYFVDKMQKGHQFENWVIQKFAECGINLGLFYDNNQYKGENAFGLEIKYDMRLQNTGNLYIEYEERLNNSKSWTKSGILKEDNSRFWLIGNPREYYIFDKITLIALYDNIKDKTGWVNGCRLVSEGEHGTSHGFILKRNRARELALSTNIKEFTEWL